jgi:hypothetical protein
MQDKSETKIQRKKLRMLAFVKKGDVTSAANKDTSNITVPIGQRDLINPHLTLLKHALPTLFPQYKKPKKKRTPTLKNLHNLCHLWMMPRKMNSLTSF